MTQGTSEFVERPEMNEVVKEVVAPYAERWGIAQLKPLAWTSENGPMRRWFELVETKGAGLALRWGASIDFVPHRTGSTLAWHRSFKSARPDLFEGTMFGHRNHPGGTTITRLTGGAHGLRKQLDEFLREYAGDITKFFEAACTIDGAIEIAREQIASGSQPFNDPCPEYVLAFLLAEKGQRSEVKPYFDAFAARHGVVLKGKQLELIAKRLGLSE